MTALTTLIVGLILTIILTTALALDSIREANEMEMEQKKGVPRPPANPRQPPPNQHAEKKIALRGGQSR